MEPSASPVATNLTSLEELMAGYQRGEGAAAARLIETLSPQLHRFFMVHVKSRPFADDILQETWLRIHKVRHTYRPGQPLLPWIYAVARNVRVDQFRRLQRIENRESPVEGIEEITSRSQTEPSNDQDFERLVAFLPESQREVVTMLKVTGMSIEEVARATSSTAGAVKQKAHRAYEKLRELLTAPGVAQAPGGDAA